MNKYGKRNIFIYYYNLNRNFEPFKEQDLTLKGSLPPNSCKC